MADSKISNLPAATLPLDGSEVVPIVQGGVTKKAANSSLVPTQLKSNATTGILQVTGPAAASTRVMTTPDANFTAARTDAAQSFTGDQTLSTGNLIIGTAGNGIDFSAASHAAGMTSELLADYEEGTWTPTLNFSGGSTGITYDGDTNGIYTKVGNVVSFSLRIGLTSKGSSVGSAVVAGFPFTAAASPASANVPLTFFNIGITFTGTVQLYISAGATNAAITEATAVGSFGAITNTNFSNTSTLLVSGTYRAA